MRPTIHLDDVCVRLSGHEVLRNVDLELAEGVTALVGRNGAGKTTLIRVLTGSLRPTDGVVLSGGSDIHESTSAMVRHRQHLGWQPQEPRLPPRMRVEEFLAYAAWLKKMPTRAADVAIEAAFDAVDLGGLRDKRLGVLSGGQRRRAALAAAVVGGPDLLLLDEPTLGLDPVQRSHFLEVVRALAPGRAILVATHLMEDVELVADRWLALDEGRVVAARDVDRSSPASLVTTRDDIRRALGLEPRIDR
ncbi:ABC transporter ATP-binding protein [Cellulomonas sp. URHD0024]|uniref:ABC transporter ATP-binding protein n=1 Tax=Cellulomonas sp. URHD0024 TaxID=1302620 RepID=UPI00041492F7|nr:ATP-binding cassette domain-containing protein [Cellulomonas sp. URHD0024]